jgi:putative PEP-CTERM system TPR-repeat lipoprotein
MPAGLGSSRTGRRLCHIATGRYLALWLITLLVWPAGTTLAAKADDYLASGRAYFDKAEFRAAVIELKNALLADPDRTEARGLLGQTYFRLGETAGAAKELERARELGATETDYAPWLARAYLQAREPQRLIDTLPPAEDQPATLRAALYALQAEAWLQQGDRDQARASLAQAEALAAEHGQVLLSSARLALLDGDEAAATASIERALKVWPEEPEVHVFRGELYRQAGDLDRALASFATALERNPYQYSARLAKAATHLQRGEEAAVEAELRQLPEELLLTQLLRGQLALRQQRFDEAAGHFEAVVRAKPDHLPGSLGLAAADYALGRYESAEQHLNRVLAQHPEHAGAAKLSATLRLRRGDAEGAIAVLEAAQAAGAPADAQLLALLGSAYLRRGDVEQGLAYLQQAAANAPAVGALHGQIALGQLAAGETGEALASLQMAVEVDPALVQADLLQVLIHLQQGDTAAALNAAQELAKRSPESPVAEDLLGLAYTANGDYTRARTHFTRAAPQLPVARLHLAKLELREGQPEAARQQYETILKTSPTHLRALLGLADLARQEKDAAAECAYLR